MQVARYEKKLLPHPLCPFVPSWFKKIAIGLSSCWFFHFGYYNPLFGYFTPEPATEFCFALNNNICKQFLLQVPLQAWEK